MAIMALQQQIAAMMIDGQIQKANVAKPLMFSSKREEVTPFINAYQLYIRIKMNAVSDIDKVGQTLYRKEQQKYRKIIYQRN